MLEIKQARPRETFNAVYVTKDNVDEFRKLAYKYCGEPISIERYDSITRYRYNRFSVVFEHNCWYTENTDPDTIGWECQKFFDEEYEIVNHD